MKSTSRLSWLAFLAIIPGTLSLLVFGALRPEVLPTLWNAQLVSNAFVDARLKYQIVTLGIALAVLAVTAAVAPHNARRFYRLGNLAAPAQPVRWLGIKATDTWKSVTLSFALIISLATGAYIYFDVLRGQSLDGGLARFLPVVLLLAAMNSFTEEAITRLSVVTALDGQVTRPAIYVISALIFGSVHFFGVPGGVLGMIMAGFLGWLLARSVAETEGMASAWFIHFLQDIIIFGGLFVVAL